MTKHFPQGFEVNQVDREVFLFDRHQNSIVHVYHLDTNAWRSFRTPPENKKRISAVAAIPASMPSIALFCMGGGATIHISGEEYDSLETVPKFSINIIEKCQSQSKQSSTWSSQLGEWCCSYNVSTLDRCGCWAAPEAFQAASVSNSLVAMFTGGRRTIVDKDGQALSAADIPVIDVLRVDSMEVRGVNVENTWVIGDGPLSDPLLIPDRESDKLYLVTSMARNVRVFCLNNASAIDQSLAKAAKPDNRKRTVAYQSAKTERMKSQGCVPCSHCCCIEVPSLPEFLECTRCETVFYCSPECQRLHWKAHKAQCKKT